MLSENQVRDYQKQGFLCLERVVEPDAIESLRAAARRIIDEFDIDRHRTVFTTLDRDRNRDRYFMDSAEAVHCFLEQDAIDEHGQVRQPRHLAINKIGHAMHDRVPAFTRFCRQAVFSAVLRDIGYRAPILWQTMYICKQPRIGGEVRWHQDASYLATAPASVVGMWIALEDAHEQNGCLWVQPGAHHSPLREIFEVEPGADSGTLRCIDDTPWPSMEEAIPVPVPAGSLVMFDGHMPHFSAHNASGRSRHAFTMHVAEKDSTWSPRNWLQRPNLGAFAL